MYKNSDKSIRKSETIEKWAKYLNKPLTRENIQMAKIHMKRGSAHQGLIKASVQDHYTHQDTWSVQGRWNNAERWRGYGATGMLTHCWWERDLVQNGMNTIWKYLLKLNICKPDAPSILPLGTHAHTHTHTHTHTHPKSMYTYMHTPEDRYKTVVSSTTHKYAPSGN